MRFAMLCTVQLRPAGVRADRGFHKARYAKTNSNPGVVAGPAVALTRGVSRRASHPAGVGYAGVEANEAARLWRPQSVPLVKRDGGVPEQGEPTRGSIKSATLRRFGMPSPI